MRGKADRTQRNDYVHLVMNRNALALVLVAAVCGCAIEPGQTRCSTYGGVTNCRTGQSRDPEPAEQQPLVEQPKGWWCTSVDDFGVCQRTPGQCEVTRARINEAREDERLSGCVYSAASICADAGCFTSAEWCAKYERRAGRDGAACVVRR